MCNLSYAVMEERRIQGCKEGHMETLFQLVDDGDYAVEKAAAKLNMTVDGFLKKKKSIRKSLSELISLIDCK